MPTPSQTYSDTEIRRMAARRAFWSRHPLTEEFHKVRDEFTLKELIEFVVAMPTDRFNACMFAAGVKR